MQSFILLALLLYVSGDFDSSLAVRDFDSALIVAGESDSLKAVVFRESGDLNMAEMYFERAFEREPSAGLFCNLWEVILLHDLSDADFRAALALWRDDLIWDASSLSSLVEIAGILNDSLSVDSLMLVLTQTYPGSFEASECISWEFYDRIYPVWNDDTARITVLEEFLEEWGSSSDLWRSRGWQYTLSAISETADSVYWRDYFYQWQEVCPTDPVVYLTAASLSIDRDSSWSEALIYAETGLELVQAQAGFRSEEVSPEEWMLTGLAIETALEFRRIFAMAGLELREEALVQLTEIIATTEFDIDDYHTKSSLYWLQGKLLLAASDTLGALGSFTESAILGDVRNRWSSKSIQAMDDLLQTGETQLQWAREYTGYSGPVFYDATESLGPDSLLSGTRVSWCDWNNDGYEDLFIGSSLYENTGASTFVDVTSEAGLDPCFGNGGVWGDINGDGSLDLVTSGKPPQVFLNIDGLFHDVTETIGVRATEGAVEGVALLDWNGDGWLDLYMASYEGGGGAGTDDAFYLGSPDGFIESREALGMVPFLDQPLCGRGVSPCDFDLDGDVDIFVSNYRLSENILWENNEGVAVNSAPARGIAGVEVDGLRGHTIGSAWGDYDNDGDWDLFTANLAHPRYIGFSDRSMLYENQGDIFSDVRASSGIRFDETHSNPLWGDFNNDGLLDLFITSIYPHRRTYLYMNKGDGQFEDVTWLSGARAFNGWGAAAGDFDLDGRLDLAIGSGDGPVLLHNETQGGNWLLVRVNPPEGVNSSAIGCVAKVIQNDQILIRQIDGGSGTTSQNSSLLHFGLSSSDSVSIQFFAPGEINPFCDIISKSGLILDTAY